MPRVHSAFEHSSVLDCKREAERIPIAALGRRSQESIQKSESVTWAHDSVHTDSCHGNTTFCANLAQKLMKACR